MELHVIEACPPAGRPGYRVVACAERCPEGRYGAGCKNFCNCTRGGMCDTATGACVRDCPPGLTGDNCENGTRGGCNLLNEQSID